jgi:hypothetical protein
VTKNQIVLLAIPAALVLGFFIGRVRRTMEVDPGLASYEMSAEARSTESRHDEVSMNLAGAPVLAPRVYVSLTMPPSPETAAVFRAHVDAKRKFRIKIEAVR